MERALSGHTSWVWAMALGELAGWPVIAFGSADGPIRTGDLASRVHA
ncbi:MAG: hypothetical protein ACRDRH_27160 [Pseudonocardia sp.]